MGARTLPLLSVDHLLLRVQRWRGRLSPRDSSFSHFDPEIGHKLTFFCGFAQRVQKAQFVIHRFHTFLFGFQTALKFIQHTLSIVGRDHVEVSIGQASLVIRQAGWIDQWLIRNGRAGE